MERVEEAEAKEEMLIVRITWIVNLSCLGPRLSDT
jgi:hypothetical protein